MSAQAAKDSAVVASIALQYGVPLETTRRAALRRRAARSGRNDPRLYRPPSSSFDHLVGAGEERRWNREAECFGGLQVDEKLEPDCLLDWQIGRPRALQN